jgi:hypothetical protein
MSGFSDETTKAALFGQFLGNHTGDLVEVAATTAEELSGLGRVVKRCYWRPMNGGKALATHVVNGQVPKIAITEPYPTAVNASTKHNFLPLLELQENLRPSHLIFFA